MEIHYYVHSNHARCTHLAQPELVRQPHIHHRTAQEPLRMRVNAQYQPEQQLSAYHTVRYEKHRHDREANLKKPCEARQSLRGDDGRGW